MGVVSSLRAKGANPRPKNPPPRRYGGTPLLASMRNSFVEGEIWDHPSKMRNLGSPLKNDPKTTQIGEWGHLMVQNGDEAQGAVSCRSLSTNEPMIIGLFCGK